MEHRIELKHARRQSRRNRIGHGRYATTYLGETIGEFRCPLCESARYLLSAGLASEGDMITAYRDGKPSITGNLGALSKMTVTENEKAGPAWSKWNPMPEGRLPLRGVYQDGQVGSPAVMGPVATGTKPASPATPD